MSQTRAHTRTTDGLSDACTDTRVNGIAEAHFNAAMEAVLNETGRRMTHSADASAEGSTQDVDIHVRNDTEDRSTINNSENNLNLNNHILNEGKLPDIDQQISDESYPSNSAFSFNYENENYDKTPEFDPEWDPG